MCVDCVKDKCPDRGSVCLETGCYLMNYKRCAECHKKEPLKTEATQSGAEEDPDTEEEEGSEGGGEELVTFNHVCTCGHVVAEHQYTFWVDGEYQEYTMTCMLCGRGVDSISVLPDDPRKLSLGVF